MAAVDARGVRWPRAVEAAPPAAAGAVRLFLLRGRRLVGDAVVEALAADRRVEMVGSAAASRSLDVSALAAADVVLVDASDDRERALACVHRIREEQPAASVLAFGLGEGVEEALLFAEAGARACLPRGAGLGAMVAAVHELHGRRTSCPPRMAAALIERIGQLEREGGATPPPAELPLTERQSEVLALLVQGLTNKEIAQRLGLAVATVKNHLHGLLARLGVHRRQDAVRTAYLTGLVDDFLPRRPHPKPSARRFAGASGPSATASG